MPRQGGSAPKTFGTTIFLPQEVATIPDVLFEPRQRLSFRRLGTAGLFTAEMRAAFKSAPADQSEPNRAPSFPAHVVTIET